jgi:hypothetical protein
LRSVAYKELKIGIHTADVDVAAIVNGIESFISQLSVDIMVVGKETKKLELACSYIDVDFFYDESAANYGKRVAIVFCGKVRNVKFNDSFDATDSKAVSVCGDVENAKELQTVYSHIACQAELQVHVICFPISQLAQVTLIPRSDSMVSSSSHG